MPLATEWAERETVASAGPPIAPVFAIPKRLDQLRDLRRAVMTRGSHLWKGTADAAA
jgi:hypothetical protein